MQKRRPSYAYGEKLMKQMGWREGKGLGRNEDGNADFIQVKKKLNTKGIGFNGVDDRWIEHQEAFDSLLNQLNDGGPSTIENKLISVEERAFKLGGRVHYSKFLRGKDLSQKKQEDLNAIVVKRKKKNNEESVPETETKEEENLSGVKTHTSSLSYQEYFTQRMEALRRQKGSSKNKDRQPSHHMENGDSISEKEGAEAAPQEVGPLEACTRFSCLDDQECSKQSRKKMRQKSTQNALEESTLGGGMFANEHIVKASVLAPEELDGAQQKPKKSKRKSPENSTRTEDIEQLEETRVKKRQKEPRADTANGAEFTRGVTSMNEQSDEATVSVSQELTEELTDQQQSKKKARKTLCDDSAETDPLEERAVEKKVKKKRRTAEDTSEASIDVTRDKRSTGRHLVESAAFEERESAVQQPKRLKRGSFDDQVEKYGLEGKAGKLVAIRSISKKANAVATEPCLESCAPERSMHKKKKEKDGNERTTPKEQQEQAESEGKAKGEAKQKWKKSEASVSDEQLAKQGGNKLKLQQEQQEQAESEVKAKGKAKQKSKKTEASVSEEQLVRQGGKKLKLEREERTETEESTQDGHPAVALEATRPAVLPGNSKSAVKQFGDAESQEATSRRERKSKNRKQTSATEVAFKPYKKQVSLPPWELGLQRWQTGHNFRYPYKTPPVTYETAAAMACWVVNTVEKSAKKITPNKVCHLSKDEYAELLGNHIYKRHRTTNWMQIPGYASELWLSKCVPHLLSCLRKKVLLEKDVCSSGERTVEEESSKTIGNTSSGCR
ncbi:hypothetical protein V5799_026582 [Amblyomma americanum]|uniref:G-patch domain-containing protein n=1 Tax=Amblyomma americanum TaxID=6943 RepID=A0AAQ4DI61_AMBAM